MAYIRRVKTKSGATAIQIAYKRYGHIVRIDHIGSAHTKDEEAALVALARQRLHDGQPSLFPELKTLNIRLKSSSSELLRRVLMDQYAALGFSVLSDEVFSLLCIARIVEPTSKIDSLRVLADLGVQHLDRHQLYRCLARVVTRDYRSVVSRCCFARTTKRHLRLVLYDVTTLYFEVPKEDAYRKPGLSKERRLEPQIIIGLLVDSSGFPLELKSFEGNTAETKTILPVIDAFCAEHPDSRVTVVADAAMMSRANMDALAQAGYHYIVGSRLTKVPYDIAHYQQTQPLSDGQIIDTRQGAYRIVYQYREKRAALDIQNIEKQITKAKRMIAGKTPVSRSRFLTVTARTKALNRILITKAYALAGIKGYVTNLDIPPKQIIDAYHELFHVEASFRMAKSDFKARPIFHRKRDAIEAHLTIVLAALAIGKRMETTSGMSIRSIVRALRPIRSGVVTVSGHEYPAEEEIPEDIHTLLQKFRSGH